MVALSQKFSGFKWIGWVVLVLLALGVAYCIWSLAFTAWLGAKQVVDPSTLMSFAEAGTKRQRTMLWLTACLPLAIAALIAFPFVYNPLKQFGDARFGNGGELRSAGLAAKVGVILGRAFGNLVIAPSPGNLLVCAPPGAGKSTGIAIPTLLTWPGSILALDTKFELWQTTAGVRARSRQKTFLFAPMSTSTHCYNPLDFLQPGPQLVDEIDRIANFLIPEPHPGDMWSAEARALFTGVGVHLYTLHGRTSVGEIWEWCRDGEATWDKCARVVRKGEVIHPEAIRLLGDFGAKPPKEASGVKSTLTGALSLWGNPIVRAATARSDFDFRDMRRSLMSVYIGVSPPDLVRIEKLLALIYQQMIDGLCRALPTKEEPHEVIMMLDEFAAAGYMPLIKKGLAFLRGYRVRVCMIVQSPAQVEELYGAAGKRSIFDTCKYRVYFQPNDLDTAKAISTELGTHTMRTRTRNVSSKGGSSRNYSVGRRELMLPDEVMRLGVNHMLVFAEGSRPFRIKKVRYFDDAQLLKRAAFAPPSVPALDLQLRAGVEAIDEEALLNEATLGLTEIVCREAVLNGMGAEARELQQEINALIAAMHRSDQDANQAAVAA
jgi:type IV secretion system protein VirD4